MTAIVTKKSVKVPQSKLYIITFNLQVTDGTVVIDQDFSCEFRPGENVADKVNGIKEQMQKAIDDYKLEKALFNNAQLNSAVTAINGGLIL